MLLGASVLTSHPFTSNFVSPFLGRRHMQFGSAMSDLHFCDLRNRFKLVSAQKVLIILKLFPARDPNQLGVILLGDTVTRSHELLGWTTSGYECLECSFQFSHPGAAFVFQRSDAQLNNRLYQNDGRRGGLELHMNESLNRRELRYVLEERSISL